MEKLSVPTIEKYAPFNLRRHCWNVVTALIAAATGFFGCSVAAAAYDLRARIQIVPPLAHIAQVLAIVGKPDSVKERSLFGVSCEVLTYHERQFLSFTTAEASICLCGDRMIGVAYSSTQLLK